MHTVSTFAGLRVWRDDRLGQLWRVAYQDGDGETLVSFPDAEAVSDFIREQLGLHLLDESCEERMISGGILRDPSVN